MKRRELLVLPLAAATFAALARGEALARPPRVGYVWIGGAGGANKSLGGLRRGFADLGYVVWQLDAR
jgi:hypothetical protein